jgi:hypothetical protein
MSDFLLKASTRIVYMLVCQVRLYDAQQLEKAEQEALATVLATALLAEERAKEARAKEILALIIESEVFLDLEKRIMFLEDVIRAFMFACLLAVCVRFYGV